MRDIEKIRADFPILSVKVHGKPLIYLDSAATSQKPRFVIEALERYYRETNSNIHRGVHRLSEEATAAYEAVREKVRRLLNAGETREILFVRGATEAINLVAASFGRSRVGEGDEILITHMEHHSNIVPWQMLAEEKRARLVVAPISDAGELIWEEFEKRLTGKTRLVSVAHVSNALGTINPVRRIVTAAHAKGIPVLVDGAQAVPHMRVDVTDLDCDFYTFSGHKLFGPTGIGVLYGKAEILEAMPPYHGGGDMISSVTFEKTTYNTIPMKFEAGTPNIAGVIGLGAAIDYVQGIGMDEVQRYEEGLLRYGTEALSAVPGLKLIGTAREKSAILSFVLDGIHPHDIGTILDQEGIAIRTGHHCAMPVVDRFGVPATARASVALYNRPSEIDQLVKGLAKVREVFG